MQAEAPAAVAPPAQPEAGVSARPARPRRRVRGLRRGRLSEACCPSPATRSPAEPARPACRPASGNGERSVAAEAASKPRASSSSPSPVCAPFLSCVLPAAVVPPPRVPCRPVPFRERPRSKATTRPARARQPRAPAAVWTSPASALPQVTGRAGAEGAASTGPRSRADRRHAEYPAGHGAQRPARWARVSRPSRPRPHRPRPRRSPSRAA